MFVLEVVWVYDCTQLLLCRTVKVKTHSKCYNKPCKNLCTISYRVKIIIINVLCKLSCAYAGDQEQSTVAVDCTHSPLSL